MSAVGDITWAEDVRSEAVRPGSPSPSVPSGLGGFAELVGFSLTDEHTEPLRFPDQPQCSSGLDATHRWLRNRDDGVRRNSISCGPRHLVGRAGLEPATQGL